MLNKLKNIFIVPVICCLVIMGMIPNQAVVNVDATGDGNSTSRIVAFLQMFANEDIDEDEVSLSESDLEFLGVYLSNWFVPFSTEFKVKSSSSSTSVEASGKDNDEDKDKDEEDSDDDSSKLATSESAVVDVATLAEVLKNNSSFDDDLCEQIVEKVVGTGMANLKGLSLYVSENSLSSESADLVKVDCIPVTGYTFFCTMLGGLGGSKTSLAQAVLDNSDYYYVVGKNEDGISHNGKTGVEVLTKDNSLDGKVYTEKTELSESDRKLLEDIVAGKYNYAYFTLDNSSSSVVFDAAIPLGTPLTASQHAFYLCLACDDVKDGMSIYMMDYNSGLDYNEGNEKNFFANLLEKLKKGTFEPKDIEKMSIYGSSVKVDCYGNIYLLGGNYKYVMVPACINPYRWVNVCTETSKFTQGGDTLMFLCSQFIGRYNATDGNLIMSGSSNIQGMGKRSASSSSSSSSDAGEDEAKDDSEDDSDKTAYVNDLKEENLYQVVSGTEADDGSDSGDSSGTVLDTSVSSGLTTALNPLTGNTTSPETMATTTLLDTVNSNATSTNKSVTSKNTYNFITKDYLTKWDLDESTFKEALALILSEGFKHSDGSNVSIKATDIKLDYANHKYKLTCDTSDFVEKTIDGENGAKTLLSGLADWSVSAYKLYDQTTVDKTVAFFQKRYNVDGYNRTIISHWSVHDPGLANNIASDIKTIVSDNSTSSSSSSNSSTSNTSSSSRVSKAREERDVANDGEDYLYLQVHLNYDGIDNMGACTAPQGQDASNHNYRVKMPLTRGSSKFETDVNYSTVAAIARQAYINETGSYNVMSPVGKGYVPMDNFDNNRNVDYYARVLNDKKISIFSDFEISPFYYNTEDVTKIFTNIVYMDTLGLFIGEVEGGTFQIASFLDVDSMDLQNSKGTVANGGMSDWESVKDKEYGSVLDQFTFDDLTSAMIYTSYLFAAFDVASDQLGYHFSSGNFPKMSNAALELDSSSKAADDDAMDGDIRNWVYYFLHPTEGIDYLRIWATNKINGVLCGFHDAMLGTTGTGSLVGTTRYKGFTGYTTCPELSDTQFTLSLMEWYENLIPLLCVLVVVVLLFACLASDMTFKRAVISAIVFFILLQLPSTAVNGVINITNSLSSQLYSEKFIYWALTQHQIYLEDITEAAESDTYEDYLRSLYASTGTATQTQGSNSITVRWQAVKKLNSIEFGKDDNTELLQELNRKSGSSALVKNLTTTLNNANSGQSYSDNANDIYLYRNYVDIGNYSRMIYNGVLDTDYSVGSASSLYWDEGFSENVANMDSIRTKAINAGYNNSGNKGSDAENTIYYKFPLCSNLVNEAIGQKETIKDATNGTERFGISSNAFAFSLRAFNTGADIATVIEETAEGTGYVDADFNPHDYSNEEYKALASYALMTESPFYFFSWLLYCDGLCTDIDCNAHYQDLLLGSSQLEFFNSTASGEGMGALKDFMDMRSLFTYIIPYAEMCNEVVREWDRLQGVYFYDGISCQEGQEDLYADDPVAAQQYWHNVNTRRMYNIYCPWTDIMADCNYAQPETITFMGDKYTIENPMDPSCYPEDRPMIFSEAERIEMGLQDSALTTCEEKILKFNEEAQKKLYNLLSYVGLSDTVLDNAAAMECLFSFNTIFSDSSLVGTSYVLYPQNFEVKDFSYDAYLRLMLYNNTVDTLTNEKETLTQSSYGDTLEEKGFYQRIVAKSSIFTSIMLVLNAIVAQYALPIAKLAFIIGIYILMIVEILVAIFKVKGSLNYVKQVFVLTILPLLQFALIMMGMSLIVAIFMGNGSNIETGGLPTITLGSPEMMLILLLAVNCIVIALLFKLVMNTWKNIWNDGRKLWNSVVGMVTGGFSALTNKLTGGSKNKSHSNHGGNSSGGGSGGTVEDSNTPKDVVIVADKRRPNYQGNSRDDMERVVVQKDKNEETQNDNSSEGLTQKLKIACGEVDPEDEDNA